MAEHAERMLQFEADRTFLRSVELDLRPVAGKFDSYHLQQIHLRLFQDLPAFNPGAFRQPTQPGKDWVKRRTIEGSHFLVAYSPLDEGALKDMRMVMSENVPAALQRLPVAKVPGAIAELYSAIDYAHPFADGNSRTLRVFTRQLARAAGFNLNWEALGGDSTAQARLYVARDLAVNARALPHIRGHANLRDVQYALDVLAQNVTLEKLLKQAIS